MKLQKTMQETELRTDNAVSPYHLFSRDILDYQVLTRKRGKARYINLDNAATTPPLKAVEKAVSQFLRTYGSVHRGAGTKSKLSTQSYENARSSIKRYLNAPEDSYLLFTGNTTGAMNIAAHFFSFLQGKIAVSAIEHSSSWLPWVLAEGTKALGQKQSNYQALALVDEKLQQQGQKQVLRYDVNPNFEFDLDSIEALLANHKIKALVLTACSNLTGYTPDIRAIAELAHRFGALVVLDACQYLQHHPLDMQQLGVDFVAASGHKFYAPYGGGFLIGPKDFFDRFLPYQIGGGNLPYITKEGRFIRCLSEQAHDAGTPNALGAISMAAALNELARVGVNNIESYEADLTRYAYRELCALPGVKLYVSEKHLSTVIPFSIEGMDPREAAERLNSDFGIGVRAGSFCVYDALRRLLSVDDESAIITAVEHGDSSMIPGIIRASFSLCNTKGDAQVFVSAVNLLALQVGPRACVRSSGSIYEVLAP